MSTFDVSNFLDATTTEQSVKRPPIPVGDYIGVIGELGGREWVSKDGTKSGVAFDVPLLLQLPHQLMESMGFTEPTLTVKDSIMPDLRPDGKSIDYSPGKSAKLRKYREATGLNVAGAPFNPRMLTGHVVTVKIGHREYPEGSGDFFEQVDGIAAA